MKLNWRAIGIVAVVFVAGVLLAPRLSFSQTALTVEIVKINLEKNPDHDPDNPDSPRFLCNVDKTEVTLEGRRWGGAKCESKTVFGEGANRETFACAVMWQFGSVLDEWSAEVDGKVDRKQKPSAKAKKIKKRFNEGDAIKGIKEGRPVTVQPSGWFGTLKEYTWTYKVVLTKGADKCTVDPEVCVRRPGSSSCQP